MENALSKKHFTPYFQVNDKTAYPKYIEFRDKVEYHKKLISEETNLQEIKVLLGGEKVLLDRFDSISDSIKQRLTDI